MVSSINGENADLSSLKSKYLQAQGSGDKTEMNKIKQEAMKVMNTQKKEGQQQKNITGYRESDSIKISKEGLAAVEKMQTK